MGIFSSKSKTKTTTSPWSYTMADLGQSLEDLRGIRGEPFTFPERTFAPQTEAEAQAIDLMKEGAGAYPQMFRNLMGPGMGAFMGAIGAPQAALDMDLQNVYNNPALAGVADVMEARLNRNLQENILPSIDVGAVGAGGLGGSRQGVAEGIAARGTQEALAESLAGLYGDAWSQGLGAETARYGAGLSAQQGAMSMMPGMLNLGESLYTRPAALLGQAGGLERAEEQRQISEDVSRLEFEQGEPWRRLGMAQDVLMPMATSWGTERTTSTSTPSDMQKLGQMMALAGSVGGMMMGGLPGLALGGMALGGMGGGGGMGGMGGGGMMGGGNPYQASNIWGGFNPHGGYGMNYPGYSMVRGY